MPILDVDLLVIGQLNDENDVVQRVKAPMTKDDWIQIHQNEVCTQIETQLDTSRDYIYVAIAL